MKYYCSVVWMNVFFHCIISVCRLFKLRHKVILFYKPLQTFVNEIFIKMPLLKISAEQLAIS